MSEPQPDPKRTTEVFAAADRARLEAEMLRQHGIENAPLINAADEPFEPPTPHVLDRRVMVKWASITLAIYILIRLMVGPVKEAVVDAVQEEVERQGAKVTNTAPPVPAAPIPAPPVPPEPAPAAEPAAPAASAAPEAPASSGKRVRVRIQR